MSTEKRDQSTSTSQNDQSNQGTSLSTLVFTIIRGAFAIVTIVVVVLIWSSVSVAAEEVGSAAEWQPAKTILMHTPKEELFLGVIEPEAALFEDTFSTDRATREHEDYIEALAESAGATVVTLEEKLLLLGARSELINLATSNLAVNGEDNILQFEEDCSGDNCFTQAEKEKREECFNDKLTKLGSRELVRIALQRPKIILRKDPIGPNDKSEDNCEVAAGYEVAADYKLNPLMNMYFMRDQMITTAKGVVIGKMARVQRRNETELVKIALEQMGIQPIYEIVGEGRLEGGDFIPAGDRVFIGNGLRTNEEAVKQMLTNDVFGDSHPDVIVVKDSWLNQQEMHLDTHFNIIDEDLVVMEEERYDRDCTPPPDGNSKCLLADVWKWDNDSAEYNKSEEGVNFVKLLEEELGFTIIPVSIANQEAYGINFLTVGPKEIMMVKGISPEYQKDLEDRGVTIHLIDFDNLKLGYGAAHCTTQVLHRE